MPGPGFGNPLEFPTAYGAMWESRNKTKNTYINADFSPVKCLFVLPNFEEFVVDFKIIPNKAPEDVFVAPLAPPILDPLGSGSKRAFFLAEAPVPDGPADCSSS